MSHSISYAALCLGMLVPVAFAGSEPTTAANTCASADCAGSSRGDPLLQVGTQNANVAANPVDADVEAQRTQLITQLCNSWVSHVESGVVKGAGQTVCCSSFPPGCQKGCSNHTSCKKPSRRDKEMYLRFAEPACNLAVQQQTSLLEEFLFQGLPEAFADNFLRSFDWDKLALWEEQHDVEVEDTGKICERDKESIEQFSSPSLLEEDKRRGEVVSSLRWRIQPVEHPLARAVGHMHSFLEIQADGEHYKLDVYPGEVGISAGAECVSPNDVQGEVYAEARANDIRPGVSVIDVLAKMRESVNGSFDLISNNCHAVIEKTFKWAAPGATAPKSPNSKWEALAAKAKQISPSSVNMLLEVSGANAAMCSTA